MDIIAKEAVLLNAEVTDKLAAIRKAGELLVNAGRVAPEYVDGMLAREEVMSTYIGNGVAIPHGTHAHLDFVQQTGISVVQVPEGVEWNPDEIAYLVFGIAAVADEHLVVLSNLAEILEDMDTVNLLAHTDDPMQIIDILSRPPDEEAS